MACLDDSEVLPPIGPLLVLRAALRIAAICFAQSASE